MVINVLFKHTLLQLVGGLEHFLLFHMLGIIIPTDQYFSGGFKPSSRYNHSIIHFYPPIREDQAGDRPCGGDHDHHAPENRADRAGH